MKWRPGIRVRAFAGCPVDVAAAVKRAARLVRRVSPVRHYLTVGIVPEFAIEDNGQLHAGVFLEPRRGYHPRIFVAGGAPRLWQKDYGWTRRRAVRQVVHVLLHEYSHYCQFRDGKPITERGVNVMAENLMKKIEANHRRRR